MRARVLQALAQVEVERRLGGLGLRHAGVIETDELGEVGGLPQRGHDGLLQLADQIVDDRVDQIRRALNALWDLRGKLLGQPAHRVIGAANRERVRVYWRPGEAKKGLAEARRQAREAFDRGYRFQKWFFKKGAKDGADGMKENIELVRVLREELPGAELMFDNHSIRHEADVAYSMELCRAIAAYKPYWVEEPICPEHVEGYARIKGETGVTIAGGEHWYTRWPVNAFLDRKCVDVVQSDPIWCGGISEWLKICALVRQYPGVRVVPHITSPWLAAPHCVASQPEALCPLLEFNVEGGRAALEGSMTSLPDGGMGLRMPTEPGLS